MKEKYTIREFNAQFPNDDACLDWLMEFMYPGGVECHVCKRVTKHHRVKSRKSYSCDVCGHHVHPTAGTIYHKSSTPLTLWFHAVFLMSNTRCGISAKQLEREIGVTYKTAHRMFKMIRSMLVEDDAKLSGTVEVDETSLYGKPRRYKDHPTKKYPKTIIAGAVERGGSIKTRIVPDNKKATLVPFVKQSVKMGSDVYTDEHGAYHYLPEEGFRHSKVSHWNHQYAIGDVHTNTIEGFWGNFKTGFRGVYKHCGDAYLPSYLREYEFRYNRRGSSVAMFNHFMSQTRQASWWTPYADRREI